jgi:hypothetical protein
MGFLSMMRRPPLYQLLSSFAPASQFSIRLPELPDVPAPAANTSPTATGDVDAGIVYRPRIVYGSHVVLARRRWTVSKSAFPRVAKNESPASYFLRVQRWRIEHGIPSQVYVRVIPQPGRRPEMKDAPVATPADTTERSPSENIPVQARPSRDFYKPQFIDFDSPLLAALFGRLSGALANYLVVIEERYPGDEALPAWKGDRRAIELILQFDMPASVGTRDTPADGALATATHA